MKKLLLTSLLASGLAMFGPAAQADDDRDRDRRDDRRSEHRHHDHYDHSRRYDHREYYTREYDGGPRYHHSHYYEDGDHHYRHQSTAHELFHELLGR